MNSRAAILARIRAARQDLPSDLERIIQGRERGPQPAALSDSVAAFSAKVLSLSSTLECIRDRDEVPDSVARYLADHTLGRALLCWPEFLDLEWLAARLSVAARPPELDDAVGVTGAFCGIAETGSLMLLSGAATPAATSLLPETHISVLSRRRIVPTLEDAWDLLRSERGILPRAVNFVSGPSRTADIEQTITLGAHGPARVHILLLD